MSNQSTINRVKATQSVVADRTRRFGYSGGVPNLTMDAKDSGLDCNPLTGGKLLMFLPGKQGYLGGWDQNKGGYRRLHVDIMPAEYQYGVDKTFHTNEDFGYRNLDMLTALRHEFSNDNYFDEADEYFAVVHPTLTSCKFGLNQKVQLSDSEVGYSGLTYQHCPTCQLADLKSQACSDRIFKASDRLDSRILMELRDVCIEANEAALRYAEGRVQAVLSDIARKMTGTQPGRNTLNTIDRIHLKMQHKEENAQTNTATDMIKSLAKEMATAIAGTKTEAVPSLSEAELAEYQELKRKEAARARMAKARDSKGVKDDAKKVETIE